MCIKLESFQEKKLSKKHDALKVINLTMCHLLVYLLFLNVYYIQPLL